MNPERLQKQLAAFVIWFETVISRLFIFLTHRLPEILLSIIIIDDLLSIIVIVIISSLYHFFVTGHNHHKIRNIMVTICWNNVLCLSSVNFLIKNQYEHHKDASQSLKDNLKKWTSKLVYFSPINLTIYITFLTNHREVNRYHYIERSL